MSANTKCDVKKANRQIYKLLITNWPRKVIAIDDVKDLVHPVQYAQKMVTEYPDVLFTSNTNHCITYYW